MQRQEASCKAERASQTGMPDAASVMLHPVIMKAHAVCLKQLLDSQTVPIALKIRQLHFHS